MNVAEGISVGGEVGGSQASQPDMLAQVTNVIERRRVSETRMSGTFATDGYDDLRSANERGENLATDNAVGLKHRLYGSALKVLHEPHRGRIRDVGDAKRRKLCDIMRKLGE